MPLKSCRGPEHFTQLLYKYIGLCMMKYFRNEVTDGILQISVQNGLVSPQTHLCTTLLRCLFLFAFFLLVLYVLPLFVVNIFARLHQNKVLFFLLRMSVHTNPPLKN